MHDLATLLWPWIGLVICVAIVALVFIAGQRLFRPTCNRCPICGRITGTPESLDNAGNPLVCGHDICDSCQLYSRLHGSK